jgi:hypothetical protein
VTLVRVSRRLQPVDAGTRPSALARDSAAGGPLVHPLRLALLLAGGYVGLCSVYVVLSSRRAAALAESIGELQHYEQFKGLGFVALTGLVFFAFSWWVLHRLTRKELALLQQRDVLANAEGRVLSGTLAAAGAIPSARDSTSCAWSRTRWTSRGATPTSTAAGSPPPPPVVH